MDEAKLLQSIPSQAAFRQSTHQQTPQQITPSRDIAREQSIVLLQSFVQVLAAKDKNTHSHVNRVYKLTQEWTTYLRRRWMHLDQDFEAIEIAALLHDIGKVGVLDEVLLKPSALTPSEREHLEAHSELGYQMIRDYPGIQEVAQAVRHHHERFDGKGYPLGLKAKQIPIGARMIAIVDAYDAITSDRPYRRARSHEVALGEILNAAGQQFCPELVPTFIQFMHARNT